MARKKVELSEYERKRQENIAKTQALLRSLEMEAAEAGLAPTAKAPASAKPKSKKSAPKKVKQEEVVPRRTSSRLRGIEADSEKAKRKAEEEHEARREADKAKRQRISDAYNFSDIVVVGKGWEGNFLSNVGPAKPYERTFDEQDIKETTDKELKVLREKMSGLELWPEFEPNELKITPERIVSLSSPNPYSCSLLRSTRWDFILRPRNLWYSPAINLATLEYVIVRKKLPRSRWKTTRTRTLKNLV